MGARVGAHLGNAPLGCCGLPRALRAFFRWLSRLRTPSAGGGHGGRQPQLSGTTCPASRRKVQWSCPSGGRLQASEGQVGFYPHITVVQLQRRLAWGRSCNSTRCSAKRCLTRYTVLSATSKVRPRRGAGARPNLDQLLFRRTRALAILGLSFSQHCRHQSVLELSPAAPRCQPQLVR